MRVNVMVRVFLWVMGLAVVSGAAARVSAQESSGAAVRWDALTSARVFVMPDAVCPGEPFAVVRVAAAGKAAASDGSAVLRTEAGERLAGGAFFRYTLDEAGHAALVALLAVPCTASAGTARVTAGDATIPLTIKPKDFHAETIPLNSTNTNIRAKPDPRKNAQSQKLSTILFNTAGDVYSEGPFQTPLLAATVRTSFYGDRRIYQYSTGKTAQAIHAGIDYRAAEGTPVHACAAGRVVLAEPRIVTGNSVIIQHLPGVYSIYYHLSKIDVKEGDLVSAGQFIGLSGKTGLATGPHLHWEIRVSGENTDPDALTARPLVSRALILGRLAGP
jgi:murein DD-endopeptidase MepM/ murein hydrolase activator NlpD